MKKVKVWLFVLACLLCSKNAKAYDFEVDGIYYNVLSATNLTAEVTYGPNSYKGTVIIPDSIEWKNKCLKVTRIGTNAFADDTQLKSVILSQSIQRIEEKAFYYCTQLTFFFIPKNVTSIGINAFCGCKNLINLRIEDSDKELEMGYGFNYESNFAWSPLKTLYIGRNLSDNSWSKTFRKMKTLESIYFGNGITKLGTYAFSECTNLTKISLENTIETTGLYAFMDCSKLDSIVLGKNIKTIEYMTFYGCSNLSYIKSYSTTPPNVGNYNFTQSNYAKVVIDVPFGSLQDYQTSNKWAEFWNIREFLTGATFKANYIVDGITIKEDSILHGDAIILAEDPIKEGYSFSGWSKVPEKMPAKDIIISGHFSINKYAITYYLDDEIYKIDSVEYNSFIKVTNPQKEGYTFSGWSKYPKTMPANDIIIKGSFAINTYAINYLIDGMIYDTDSITYNSTIVLKEEPTKEGHTFSGWSKIPEVMPANDVVVEGIFTINKYKLTYIVDEEKYASDSIAYGETIILKETPIKEGYTFSGWSEAPRTMPANDIVISGSFTINTYNLTYNVDGIEYKKYEVTYGDTLVVETEPTKEGYTFSGWTEIPATMPANDVTIEGKFNINHYLITYMIDSVVYATDTLEYASTISLKETPVKEGYTFSGWSEASGTMPANDIVISGSFTINTYNLTYNVDGIEYKKYEVTYGDTFVAEAEPTKEGYTFSGWSEIPTTMPANDVIIGGVFNINTYKVTYMLDGEIFQIDSLAYGSSIVTPEAPAKEDYEFNGWSETPKTMPANDLTVTGTYTLLVYCDTPTISYKDGKLMYECTTEGATCVTNIVSTDFEEHMGDEMELTLTYQVNVYAKAEGYAKSPVATAIICWIECDHKSDAHGVEAIPATVVLIKASNGTITIEGLEADTPVAIYATSGTEVANGVAEEDATLTLETNLQKGDIAIVKMSAKSVKVVMK